MNKLVGSEIDVRVKTNAGNIVDVSVIMVPVAYQGHLFAMHFISEK